jgi:beta-1,4-mannosyl-glycoprotein beta-1,4-N-acetylglucosaminyltransferase
MKIIDCFTFYNELDILEIRLTELNDIVDYFVLVECIKTHVNNDKELFFENNKKRYSKFLHKIIHIIVKDNIPQTSNPWDIENYQRRCIDQGIKQLDLKSEDIIIISDLDEIPDSNTLLSIKNYKGLDRVNGVNGVNEINGIYNLVQDLYYYNLNCKSDGKWYHPKILNYGSYNNDPQSIRDWGPKINGQFEKGGWHLSYFGDIEFIKNKIRNQAHQEFNHEHILNHERITKQIQNCSDLYERYIDTFKFIDENDNIYLPHKYKEFKTFLLKKL